MFTVVIPAVCRVESRRQHPAVCDGQRTHHLLPRIPTQWGLQGPSCTGGSKVAVQCGGLEVRQLWGAAGETVVGGSR